MGQLIIIPNEGEIVNGEQILPSDLIAYYKFEETKDLGKVKDWAMNFDGECAASHQGQSSRVAGYQRQGLLCYKNAGKNFEVNMLLDEIPSSLEITLEFYIKFLEEIKKGEHATYTIFSKQWASGMKWYLFIVSRLEVVQIHNCFSYLVLDETGNSVQVKKAEWNSLNANGLYYKKSDILYEHSVYSDWRIYFDGADTKWKIQKKENTTWKTYFENNSLVGTYTAKEGQGKPEVSSVSEVNDEIVIDVPYIAKDKWYQVVSVLKLRNDLPSSFSLYFGDYNDKKLTSEIVNIPVNTEIQPQLIGGDLSNFKFCTNDNTIPYVVEGYPLPSSYRFGCSAVIDEVRVWRVAKKEIQIIDYPKLYLTIYGAGSVNVNPNKEKYNWKEQVTLQAVPETGQNFIKWHGDVPSGHETDNPLTIIMDGDKHITAEFTGKVATPQISPAGGTYYEEQTITITCITQGATIHYTIDESEPTESSPIYTQPIQITQNTILKAKAFKTGYTPSDTKTEIYYLKVKTPSFSPQEGTYPPPLEISISTETQGATIHYTTNGNDPDENSPVYSSPIIITTDTTLKAKGYKTNWQPSEIKTGQYLIKGNIWTRKADFGGVAIQRAVGFSINGKGYIGTGSVGKVYLKDFWEYNPDTNTWTQKADFGGVARFWAVGFSIGSKGYIGTGWGSDNNLHKDFWEYNPETNTWTQKADFGGIARYAAVGFSINDRGYIGTGFCGGDVLKDFWEYNPSTDTWTQKADFGGVKRTGAVGFSINGKGYIGTGTSLDSYLKDFWEYNPDTNIWIRKADFGGVARGFAVGFSIDSKGYIGTGWGSDNNLHKDFWEYNPETNTWTQKADFGGIARYAAVGFSINDRGYIGTGYDGYTYLKDFWEYIP